jgi:hypothetical protein
VAGVFSSLVNLQKSKTRPRRKTVEPPLDRYSPRDYAQPYLRGREVTGPPHADDEAFPPREPDEAEREAQELEDGSLDPDELTGEPAWWDEGSDDET